MRPVIYIASPYIKAHCADNVRRSMLTWHDLWNAGFAPISPAWTHFQRFLTPLEYSEWMEYDLTMLAHARPDAILQLDGESAGAAREVAWAKAVGVPVYYSINALLDAFARIISNV